MLYALAADAVMVVHFGWIMFLIGGWIIGRHIPWVKWTHLCALGYSVLLQVFSWICPLTYLENWLRSMSTGALSSGSFIEQHLEPIIYMETSRGWLLFVTGLVIAISALAYSHSRRSRPITH